MFIRRYYNQMSKEEKHSLYCYYISNAKNTVRILGYVKFYESHPGYIRDGILYLKGVSPGSILNSKWRHIVNGNEWSNDGRKLYYIFITY